MDTGQNDSQRTWGTIPSDILLQPRLTTADVQTQRKVAARCNLCTKGGGCQGESECGGTQQDQHGGKTSCPID
jgi:hypothetical protein